MITLTRAPDCINVEIECETLVDLPSGAKEFLEKLSLFSVDRQDAEGKKSTSIVLPIGHSERSSKPFTVCTMECPLNTSFDAECHTHFPLDMNLAITVNKAEGQTLKKGIILALSQREKFDFDHRGFCVGVSRTEIGDDVKKFLLGETEFERNESTECLCNLEPDHTIEGFFAGCGSRCDHSNWTTKEFQTGDVAAHHCTTEGRLS